MRLTAMDINNKEFKKSLRGYNADEVDEFIEKVIEDYEALYKENSTLKEKNSVLSERLEHYAKIEATIQNTLLLAQNAAEQAKVNAQKEADMIIKNANDTAQKILDKAHADVMAISDDYDKLKQEFFKFRAKYRNFLKTQMDTFDDLEKDFIKNYNIGSTIEDKSTEVPLVTEKAFALKEIEEENFNNEELNEIKRFFVKDN
ncbi:DivIVA domain-containing protein [Clostridium thermarum]|uniref:DivIVA domain-containing protein n=1 Tax=Clostridium thermarum TaxID=1716543 RepID=UPI0013D4A785|nr:DivIVA domain-containing protein [Clostridium thermarum]